MAFIRHQLRWVTLLVIAALLASPVARAHCYVIKNIGAALAAAAHSCHEGRSLAAAADHATADHHERHAKHERWSDCPVCLALAVSTAGTGGLPVFAGPAPEPRPGIVLASTNALADVLRLGGVGSRAPPA